MDRGETMRECSICGQPLDKVNSGWTDKGEFEVYRCPHCGQKYEVQLGFKGDRE